MLPDSLAAARQWEAYFQIAPANKQTAQSAAPVRYSCIKTDTTLCEGGSLTWKGTTYPQTPYIGTDTFTSGYDSLILTIVAIPRVTVGTIAMTCDQANEIRIPFSVAHGTPDTYDIAVNGSHYAGAVDGSDIVFSLTTMEAGDYAATMTVSAAGTECESTQDISFTIALSGQMYSKWTDVLFISNKGIWRINRDIRFSLDKRPYKEWFGCFPAAGVPGQPKTWGKKSMRGGYYVHIQPGQCMFAGGIWDPSKELLTALRKEIEANYEEVEEIMGAKAWKKYFDQDFDTMWGGLKKVPAGFDPDFKHPEWLKHKAYTFSTPLTDDEVCAPDFIDRITEIAAAAKSGA